MIKSVCKTALIASLLLTSACAVPLKMSVRGNSDRKYEVSFYIFYGGIDNFLQVQPFIPLFTTMNSRQMELQYNDIQAKYNIDKNWLKQIHFGATVNF
jgi:hypothetical protein